MFDHVAVLVRKIEDAVAHLGDLGVSRGAIEEFPAEGTRELYIGEDGRAGRLLLMQPLGDTGPYARAMRKRGPGLHHVAFRTPKLKTFLEAHQGWLLHPISLETQSSGTIWLARPGMPLLVEVVEGDDSLTKPALVDEIRLPIPEKLMGLATPLGIDRTSEQSGDLSSAVLGIAGRLFDIAALSN